jgi:hypothetical protein
MSTTPHVNKSTACGNCGHGYGVHCESGMPHFDCEDHRYSCITHHCICGPCQCPGFVNPFTGAIAAWKRPVEETTPCATCGHPKKHHCRKGRATIEVDGVPYGCRHYMAWLALEISTAEREPCSDSTACAEVLDAEQQTFCPCPRFVSPYARPRQKKRTTITATKESKSMNLFEPEDLARAQARYLAQHAPQARPKTKTKAEILCEIATEDPTVTVAELATAAERSPSWVRKHLRAAGIVLAKPTRRKKVQP